MLGKKIYDYLPNCSNDKEDDDDEDEDDSSAPQQIVIRTGHDEFSSRNGTIFDSAVGFEFVKEDVGIVYTTALGPPPWHRRPKESILVYYEPAVNLDDE